MADGESKADGIVIFFYNITDDLVYIFTKRPFCILHIRKTANNKPCKIFQLAAPFQLIHHPVNIVAVFADIFQEKNTAFCFDIGI